MVIFLFKDYVNENYNFKSIKKIENNTLNDYNNRQKVVSCEVKNGTIKIKLYGLDISGILDKIVINIFSKFEIKRKNQEELFMENKVKNLIIDFKSFLVYQNIENKKNYFKKYYYIPEVEKELQNIRSVNLYRRKKYVNDNFDKVKNILDEKEHYINLIKLLIRDNTNSYLVEEYLKFIKEHGENIKKMFPDNYEEYKNELNFYYKYLRKESAISIMNENKLNEKINLINILDTIAGLPDDNVNKFKETIYKFKDECESMLFFNQPLDFNQNSEILFFECKLTLVHSLNEMLIEDGNDENKIKEDLKLFKQKFIKVKKIIDYLGPQEIEYLIFITIGTNTIEEFNHGYNCLFIESVNYVLKELALAENRNYITNYGDIKKNYNIDNIENIIRKFIKIKPMLSLEDNNLKYFKDDSKNCEIYEDYKCLCFNNLINNNSSYKLENYIYDYMYKKPPNELDINRIKSFLKKILNSECFKSAFKVLNGDNEIYPFFDEEYKDYFINTHISFQPLKCLKLLGFTIKFSQNIYLNSFNYNNHDNANVKKILHYSLSIFGSIHEFGHNNTNSLYFMSNCSNEVETPRNENIKDSGEGGNYLELILFGEVLNRLSLAQALYILNEENYKKNCLEFQKGFANLNVDDLTIKKDGIFHKEYNEIKNVISEKNYSTIFIQSKKRSQDEPYITFSLKNDVLGRVRK